MPIGFLIGLGGGLVSALLFYSAARGSLLFGTMLLLSDAAALAPRRTRLGLAAGGAPVPPAGALVMARRQRAVRGAVFPGARAVPVVLSSPAISAGLSPAGPRASVEWYPAGRLSRRRRSLWRRSAVLVLPLIGGSYERACARHGRVLPPTVARELPKLGAAAARRRSRSRRSPSSSSPPCRGAGGLLDGHLLFNLYLGGRIARASGRLGRAWPDLPAMSYPPGFPLLLARSRCRLLRAGHRRRRRHQLRRRAVLRLPDRRARPGALHRQRPRRPSLLGRLRRALSSDPTWRSR